MTNGLTGIITQLENQKSAIDRALGALRSLDGADAASAAKKAEAANSAGPAEPARKRTLTPEGRKRLAAAMRKRWRLAKAVGTTPIQAVKKAGRKGQRRRLLSR